MKKILGLGLVLVFFGGVAVHGLGREDKKENPLMVKKLKHSQKILEGLALSDFGMIARNAEDLIAISKEAQWKTAIRSSYYEVYSNDFRRIAANLAKKAEEKNLDGAALAYVELTLSCVRCHKHVREVRMARK